MNDEKIKPLWDLFLETELACWLKWHDYWMEKAREGNVPIFFFRFEDLLVTPEPVLRDMFRFILGTRNIDGTVIERRIREVIKTGKNFLYKPRQANGGLHKHAEKISKDQMKELMEKLEYYLHFFGYAKDESCERLNTTAEEDSERTVDAPETATFDDGKTTDKQEKNGVTFPLKLDFYDYKGCASDRSRLSYLKFLELNR